MELSDAIKKRTSIRKYSGEAIPKELLDQILEAGLMGPSAKNYQSWEFIVVRNKFLLEKLSGCRPIGPKMLAGADCAVVVVGDSEKQDVWIEDCSIALTLMHLMADSLGVGSCWIQGRLRKAPDGKMAEDYVRNLLRFPEKYKLEGILSLGMPAEFPAEKEVTKEMKKKIHSESW